LAQINTSTPVRYLSSEFLPHFQAQNRGIISDCAYNCKKKKIDRRLKIPLSDRIKTKEQTALKLSAPVQAGKSGSLGLKWRIIRGKILVNRALSIIASDLVTTGQSRRGKGNTQSQNNQQGNQQLLHQHLLD
jgi:hypothetical protein